MTTLSSLAVLAAGLAAAACAQGPSNLGIFEGAGDIGAPSHKGSVTYDAARKEYRIVGGGNNMWGVRDDFFFVWKKIAGDAIMTANVKIVSDGAPHRKAGLIIRKDLDPAVSTPTPWCTAPDSPACNGARRPTTLHAPSTSPSKDRPG